MTRVVTVAIGLALTFSGCQSITGASDIMYEVTGTGRASITYSEDDSTNQSNDVTLPWTHSFRASRGEFLYVSAQRDGGAGCVFARIYKKGEVLESGTGCGAFAIATASGTN